MRPIGAPSDNGQARRLSDPSDVNQAQAKKSPGDGPGGVRGGLPRAASLPDITHRGPFKALRDYVAKLFGKSASTIPNIQAQAENRQILKDLEQKKESPFTGDVKEGVKEGMALLEELPHLPKDLEGMAIRGLRAGDTKNDSVYTHQSLTAAVRLQTMESGVKASAVGETMERLKILKVPCDEGTASVLLTAASQSKDVRMKDIPNVTTKEGLKSIQQQLAQHMVTQGGNKHRLTETREAAQKECLALVKKAYDNEPLKVKTEMAKVERELKEAGRVVEDRALKNSGGRLTGIPKGDFENAMQVVVKEVSSRLGVPYTPEDSSDSTFL